MKKLVIASAVAAAFASGAVFADTTAYGKVGLSIQLATEDGVAAGTDEKNVENVTSRFGFKGKEDLGNGMSSFYRYEAGTGDDQGAGVGTRLLYAGLEGDFGQVGVGSQWTPTYTLVRGTHDPFNTVGGNVAGGNFAAATRTSDAIWYLKAFGDVTFAAAIVAADGTDLLNDATDIAISAPVGPVTLAFGMQQTDADRTYTDGNTGNSQTALSVNYAADGMSVALGLFQTDMDEDWMALTASFQGFTAQFEDDGNDNQTSLGYAHKMGKQTTLFVEMSTGDVATDETNAGIVVTF